MRRELIEMAADLARRGEPFALATVVARGPPISAQVGDTALVTRDGSFFGWVGGSCTRPTVIEQSLRALEDSRPRLVALDPNPASRRRPGLEVFAMTCHSGGSVEIHIQPVVPAPELLVYGVSPTARALVRLGHAMGYRVVAVDPAADDTTFSGADVVVTDPATVGACLAGGGGGRGAGPQLFAVVATQGQWDEGATESALAQRPFYLAVMASGRRFGEVRSWLADRADASQIARIKNPAGLDLGATLPEEIAISVLAEIVRARRAKPDAAAHPEPSAAAPPPPPPTLAQDPVCGMSVVVEGAAHTAAHGGRTFYFCCGGCKERFASKPERYLDAAEAR